MAIQRRQWHFGLTLDRVEFHLGRQYITRAGLWGTLMSHYLCRLGRLFLWLCFPLPLSVLLLATGMVEPPSSAALVARRRPALAGQARLGSTICTAVALPTVARRAHTHVSASNMFDGLICTLCEGLGLMRQIRLRARRLTPTA